MTETLATGWDDAIGGHEALRRYAPAAADALDDLVGAVSADPAWVALARRWCATTLDLEPLPSPSGAPQAGAVLLPLTSLPAREQTLVRFCEQFSVDVSDIDDALRSELAETLGEGLGEAQGRFVAMTYVADFVPRVRTALDRLFPSTAGDWPDPEEQETDDAMPIALEFVRVVYNHHELDPVLSELVRLRGAQAHNCRLCKSLRSRPSLEAGATEHDFASIDEYQNAELHPDRKAAFALADAIIWQPARIPEAVIDDVRAIFRPAQAVEIVLDVMRNAWNKTMVTVALDEPNVASGFQVYEFNADGTLEFAPTGA